MIPVSVRSPVVYSERKKYFLKKLLNLNLFDVIIINIKIELMFELLRL